MIGFPGSIYDAEGVSLMPGFPALTPEQMANHPHRSMVARAFRDAAVALMSNGRAILILSRPAEPGADVRDGLLKICELADALPNDAAAQA